MSLTKEDIALLSQPFDEKTIGIKVQSFSRDKTKAMLVAYVQHTDCYTRIEQVDPAWEFQVISSQKMDIFNHSGEKVDERISVRGKLTIKGSSRENAGEGGDEKSAISDCIKRCSMLFGVGRYLYDSEGVWVEYNDSRDKFRSWTFQDYRNAMRRDQAPLPVGPTAVPPLPRKTEEPPKAAAPAAPAPVVTRASLGQAIMKTADQIGLTQQVMAEWIYEEFKKDMKSLSIQEMQRFLETLQREVGRQGA
jgi:hypothetical protein